MFTVSLQEIEKYQEETAESSMDRARDFLLKQKLIEHLKRGGAAEPVLLLLLQDWLG